MGRQLFEKEGLYLHKRPWKGKTYRKKDRMREQEREEDRKREGKNKREKVGGEWTTLAKPLGDKSCG